jgi:hypothetical protein
MELITERSLIATVSERWREQYSSSRYPDKQSIAVRLEKLDLKTATAEQVKEIIGNDSWTRVPRCSECGTESVARIVRVGEEPDYDSNTAYLCPSCVCKAMKLVEK